jgi:hypothetical protein
MLALGTLAAAVASASCSRLFDGVHGAGASAECACPPGATPTGNSGCACRSDLRLVLGACVSARVAAAHCGASAIPAESGCAARAPCERGRARDRMTGDCVATRDVRSIAAGLGILVAEDEVLECAGERELAAASTDGRGGPPSLGCVARPSSSPAHACPAGSILDLGGACVRLSEGGGCGRDARIDVVRWLRAAIGPDGGEGASPLCGALARAPGALAPATGQGDPRLAVSLAFPDNDVTLVVADVRALGGTGAVEAAETAELARAVAPMVEALRSLGGTASQATVATTVHCPRTARDRAERPSAAAASELRRNPP